MKDELMVTIPLGRYEALIRSEKDLSLMLNYLMMTSMLDISKTGLYFSDSAICCMLELLGEDVKGRVAALRKEEEKREGLTDQCPADAGKD